MSETGSEDTGALADWLEAHGLSLPGCWKEQVEKLRRAVVAANERVNLTRITGERDFLAKHIADSLLIAFAYPRLRTEPLAIADIGCGAGFPGLPLAITFPSSRVTEVDSAAKKVSEVERIIGELEIGNARTVHARGRELAHRSEHERAYDLVVSRAVSDTPSLLRECRRLVRPGGSLVVYKTPGQAREEKALTEREAAKHGLLPELSIAWTLPQSDGERCFWIITAPPG